MHPLVLTILVFLSLIAYFNLGWVVLYYSFNQTTKESRISKFLAGPGELFRPGAAKRSFMREELYDAAHDNYAPDKAIVFALFPFVLLVVTGAWLAFLTFGGIAKQFFGKVRISDIPRR